MRQEKQTKKTSLLYLILFLKQSIRCLLANYLHSYLSQWTAQGIVSVASNRIPNFFI